MTDIRDIPPDPGSTPEALARKAQADLNKMNVYCEGSRTTAAHERYVADLTTTEHGGLVYTCKVCDQRLQIGHKSVQGIRELVAGQPSLDDGVSLLFLNQVMSRFAGAVRKRR